MKKKLFKYRILVDSVSKTTTFKVVLILSFITAIYGTGLSNMTQDFFLSIVIPHSFVYFNIMFFVLLLINTLNTCNVVIKNYSYIIRLKNRKNLAKNIVIVNLIVNVVWMIVFLLMFLSILCLFRLEHLNLYNIKSYGVNVLIYTLFYILRYYVFAILIATIFSLIYLKIKEKKAYLIILLFIVGFLFGNSSIDVIRSFQILPWKYFEMITYTSFMLEISYSLLYCIFLEIIILILYKVSQAKIKFKVSKLYFFMNDLDYFMRKHVIVIMLFLLLPVISSIVCSGGDASGSYLFQTALGLNIEKNNPYILSVLMYIFNILGGIYLFIQSFIKDYGNVSNIYLRYNYKKFFIMKSKILSITFLLLKMFQYELLYVVILIFGNGGCNKVINLFFNDLFFVLFLSFSFILLYISCKIFRKMIILIWCLGIILISVFIIRPLNLTEINFIYYAALSIFEIVIINYILVKNNKKVIEKLGGV